MPIRLVLDLDLKERLKEFLEFYYFFGSDWDFKQRLKDFSEFGCICLVLDWDF